LVFELEPMYATSDRRTDGQTTDSDHCLMPPPLRGGDIIIVRSRSLQHGVARGLYFWLPTLTPGGPLRGLQARSVWVKAAKTQISDR